MISEKNKEDVIWRQYRECRSPGGGGVFVDLILKVASEQVHLDLRQTVAHLGLWRGDIREAVKSVREFSESNIDHKRY